MSRGRSKAKTATIQLRVTPELKDAAVRAAEQEHRDLTNWLEFLMRERCKQLDIDTETEGIQEDV